MESGQQIVPNPVNHPSANGNDHIQNGMPAIASSGAPPVINNKINSQFMLQMLQKEMQSSQSSSAVLTNGSASQTLLQPQTQHSLITPMVPMRDRAENLSSIHKTLSSATPMAPMMPGPAVHGTVPQIQNILSTVNLCCKLDLIKIVTHTRNSEYNPERFSALIMRIREPRTTALIFSSGKLVCTGAKTEDDSHLAARKYARIIQMLGFQVKFSGFKIHNIVGLYDVKFPIRLEGIELARSNFSSYDPGIFPGLVYRLVRPRVVLLIFCSGKVIVTGAKVRQEIYEAFDKMYPLLKRYKKE